MTRNFKRERHCNTLNTNLYEVSEQVKHIIFQPKETAALLRRTAVRHTFLRLY